MMHPRTLSVLAVVVTLYAGGPNSRGQCTYDWLPGEWIPGIDGVVYVAAASNDGPGAALYVAGELGIPGTAMFRGIAKWDPATRTWSSLGSGILPSGINRPVSALAVLNGKLYAGGSFTSAGGVAANNIACWDPATQTWAALGSVVGNVHALTALDGKLYAGGSFTSAGGVSANRVACWDPTTQTWAALGSGVNSTVSALATLDGKLYAGGNFTTAGGTSANRIACWDPGTQTWSPLGSGMDNGVLAMAALDGKLYAGGEFATAGGMSAVRVACWDPASQAWSALGSGADDVVRALVGLNGKLYMGGSFASAGGVSAGGIASWDPVMQTWSSLGSGTNSTVFALAALGGKVYAGGSFTTVDGKTAYRVACWDPPLQTWSALGSGMNGSVRAITSLNGKVYAAGWFATAGDANANYIACWNPPTRTWSALGSGLGTPSGAVAPGAYALAILDGKVYVGGDFRTADGKEARAVACWNPATRTWSALGSGIGGPVSCLAPLDGKLYAGGWFTSAGGQSALFIACWDPATQSWSTLGSGMGGYVYALAALDGRLYAGGWFGSAGGVSARGVACWNPATQTWSPLGSGIDGSYYPQSPPVGVYALTALDGKLYAGGWFNVAGGVRANLIACWDPSIQTWSALGSGLTGATSPYDPRDPDAGVHALVVSNGKLYAGGSFTIAGGASANRIACWDPATQTWGPLGSGVGGGWRPYVYALNSLDGTLYAGGDFRTAGDRVSAYWARWGLTGPDNDADYVPNCIDNCPETPNADQADADADGAGDACDACPGFDDRIDCNSNGVPDGCDIRDGTSSDCNANHVPDECEADADGDGLIDDCDACPDSDRAATIVIDDCDTRVPNRMLGDEGCTMADRIAECAEGARNHGAFVNRVAHLVNAWRHRGLINIRQAAAIQRCAARADIPRPHGNGGTHRR